MSVEVYLSKGFSLGNRLFEYTSARLYAEKYKLNLLTELDAYGVIEAKPSIVFHNNQLNDLSVKVMTTRDIDQNNEIKFYGYIRYYFTDYYQNSHLFRPYRELIKSYFILDKVDKNTDDLVMHLRLGDFMHSDNVSEVIHPDCYLKILEDLKDKYRMLYIVVNDVKEQWEKDYLERFNKYSPIIISGTMKEDFNFIRRFTNVIVSNSTFAYWAAFLGNAENIYSFNKSGYFQDENNMIKCHGNHIRDLDKIISGCKSYDTKFYQIKVNH
jgi:hypothetical protein